MCKRRALRTADNRLFINAVFWVLRTGAPWRDLPPDLGDWKNTQRRFCRWRDRGVWEKLLEVFVDEPDCEWLMIDARHCEAEGRGSPEGASILGDYSLYHWIATAQMRLAMTVKKAFFLKILRICYPPLLWLGNKRDAGCGLS